MPLENAPVGSPGFGRNVATEIKAGKPQKQAVAIAYRQAGERKDGTDLASGIPLNAKLDDCIRMADALYARADAMSEGRWDAEQPKKPAEGVRYNAEAVQKEIAKDPRIKGREAKMIHALLRGHGG
jgi:hypothetical protein